MTNTAIYPDATAYVADLLTNARFYRALDISRLSPAGLIEMGQLATASTYECVEASNDLGESANETESLIEQAYLMTLALLVARAV